MGWRAISTSLGIALKPQNCGPLGNKQKAQSLALYSDVIPNVTNGYNGAAPDLGALEVGLPVPHYGPRLETP